MPFINLHDKLSNSKETYEILWKERNPCLIVAGARKLEAVIQSCRCVSDKNSIAVLELQRENGRQ